MATRFGEFIRQLREQKDLGLKRAAPEIGLSYSYLSKLENGLQLPSDETLARLAEYYDLDIETLSILAGRIPEDILRILQNDPEGAVTLLRERFGHGQ